jgi:hypothetical protein
MPTPSNCKTKAEREAAHQARMARMDNSFARLEAELAQVGHKPACEICDDLKWVSPANADPERVKLVPCPACGELPAPEAPIIEDAAMINWYADHQIDPTAQAVMDMGDEVYGD